MKKIISLLLLLPLCFSFTACGKTEAKEISCDEIIAAYENAGYTVEYHNHRDTDAESDVVCNIRIEDPKNPKRNYLYIDRYLDESKAKAAAEDAKYNLVVWFIFAISGESRWLKSEYYGNIHYHTFNDEITKPLEGLMKLCTRRFVKKECLIISSGQGNLPGVFCAQGLGMPLEIEMGKYSFRQFVHIAILTKANKRSIIASLRTKPIAQSRRGIGRTP